MTDTALAAFNAPHLARFTTLLREALTADRLQRLVLVGYQGGVAEADAAGQPLQRVPGNRGLHAPAAVRRQAGADGALVGLAAQRAAAGVYEGIGGHGRSVEAITHCEWRGQEKCTRCTDMECIFDSCLRF